MKAIACDHCSTTAPHNHGQRGSSKPVGWARLSISVKPAEDLPVQTLPSCDLCPPCLRLLRAEFLNDDKADA